MSSEQVGDLTKGETLDTAKTDRKDARVIHLAAAMGKTQRHRDLPEPYVLLRHLTAFHDDEVRATSAIRTRLQARSSTSSRTTTGRSRSRSRGRVGRSCASGFCVPTGWRSWAGPGSWPCSDGASQASRRRPATGS